mmetsp:Transcript_8478/g.25310  ORF Transcript_8478/g.25310 Transcript_8478/m.25310 type:complete len:355 (-) Transcript_8478:11-1075(-)
MTARAATVHSLSANGTHLHKIELSIGVTPSAYALLSMSISVLCQAVAFISVGALGDYGAHRKTVFEVTSTAGSLACICCLLVTPESWWLGIILLVVINVNAGVSWMMYQAWLPLLAAAHPEVRSAEGEFEGREFGDRERKFQEQTDALSARGFMWGFAGAIGVLMLTVPLLFLIPLDDSYRIGVAVIGAWWFVFQFPSFKRLRQRPGPPLPRSAGSYIGHSWRRTWVTLQRLRELPNTFRFIALWAVFSEGMNTIAQTAILMANGFLKWGCINKGIGLAAVIVGNPIIGAISLKLVRRWQKQRGWEPKKLTIWGLYILSIIPAYALIGFVTEDFGFHYGWEMFVLVLIYAPGAA